MIDEFAKIPSKVNLEMFDTSVFTKDKIRDIFRAGKLPTADAMIDEIILRAIKEGATDIHIEPKDAELRIRLGSEGVLKRLVSLPKEISENVASVVKTKANINQFEKKKPQEGRFVVTLAQHQFEIRVNTLPSITGERLALRVFSKVANVSHIDDMGFSPENLDKVHHLLHRPSGLILAAGPSGSGVSTILTALLNALQSTEKNIITIENPVEIRFDFATQIQLPAEKDFSIGETLRPVLRQSPNIIMLSEIRDQESGVVAAEAVLGGVLVLSTVLANDSIGTIPRLRNYDISAYWLATALAGIISQKLIRKICDKCKEECQLTDEELSYIGGSQYATYYRGKGCEECDMTGYRGRTGIHEVLTIDDRMRDLIYRQASFLELKEAATAAGFQDFHVAAVKKAIAGVTTVEEIIRALG